MTWTGLPLRVQRSSVLLMVTMIAIASWSYPSSPAVASCAGPYLDIDHRFVLQAGLRTTVEGRAFVDGCQDSESCSGFGCHSCEYDDPAPTPRLGVRLRLLQGERGWTLALADAGSADDELLGVVSWTFTVPPEVRPGPASLVADGAPPVGVRIAAVGESN